jgi:DNA/RNA-binding domain of Phe-tRNA-synthetase-like protein
MEGCGKMPPMASPEASGDPFAVAMELPGWELFWVPLTVADGVDAAPGQIAEIAEIAALRREAEERARAAFASTEELAAHPTAAALRRLFRAAGCDPTRYRPSSEALLRRVLKGEGLPAIHPLVDVNNCLSIDLAVPCCVLAEGSFAPPLTLRAGRDGESFDSLRGPFPLAGKPLLADAAGPFGTPVTDSQRVKVKGETRRAWLVAYLPAGVVSRDEAGRALAAFLARLSTVEAG